MASSSEIVTAHKGILRRDPIAGDFTHYAAWPTSMMIDNLVDSVEARDYIFPLVMLYDAVLGRRPDSAGLDFWATFYRANQTATSLATMATGFLGSTEGKLRFPPNDSNLQFMQKVYSLVLRRTGNTAELAYWDGVLGGGFTRGQLFAHFVSEIEYKNKADSGIRSFLTEAGKGLSSAYTGVLF